MSLFRNVFYDHKWKVWGIALSAAGLLAMAGERLHSFVVINKLSADTHFYIFQWLMLLGLFVVIFSKEKNEDDRAKAIRAKAFQMSFIIQQALLLSVALTHSMDSEARQMAASHLFVYSAVGIFVYLLVFYIGLYFDFFIEYDNEVVRENTVDSKAGWAIIAYLLCSVVLLSVILFFGEK